VHRLAAVGGQCARITALRAGRLTAFERWILGAYHGGFRCIGLGRDQKILD